MEQKDERKYCEIKDGEKRVSEQSVQKMSSEMKEREMIESHLAFAYCFDFNSLSKGSALNATLFSFRRRSV
jgi:hypothetical protein